MDNLKVQAKANISLTWRDEIGYSHDMRSEGVEQLKEAIKQVKTPHQPSSPNDSSED
jgi:hypothetical protein